MEKFSFFNSIGDDRVYDASDFALYFSKYFTNGIFNNGLSVSPDSGMNIKIESGHANINGYRYTNTTDLIKSIETADGLQSRIDNVILRWDLTNRQIGIVIVKGDYADSPVPPSIIRSSTVFDLRIATISVPSGTTEITASLITDTRQVSEDCGIVMGAVSQIDTTELFSQYQAWFTEWFESVKGQLSTDVAGNLQNEIDTINAEKWEVVEISDEELSQYTYEE